MMRRGTLSFFRQGPLEAFSTRQEFCSQNLKASLRKFGRYLDHKAMKFNRLSRFVTSKVGQPLHHLFYLLIFRGAFETSDAPLLIIQKLTQHLNISKTGIDCFVNCAETEFILFQKAVEARSSIQRHAIPDIV